MKVVDIQRQLAENLGDFESWTSFNWLFGIKQVTDETELFHSHLNLNWYIYNEACFLRWAVEDFLQDDLQLEISAKKCNSCGPGALKLYLKNLFDVGIDWLFDFRRQAGAFSDLSKLSKHVAVLMVILKRCAELDERYNNFAIPVLVYGERSSQPEVDAVRFYVYADMIARDGGVKK